MKASKKVYCSAHSDARAVEDVACVVCGSRDDSACPMLLCDDERCNAGYHLQCLSPPLAEVPPEDVRWWCPACVSRRLALGTMTLATERPAPHGRGRGRGRDREWGVAQVTRCVPLTGEYVAALAVPRALAGSDEEDSVGGGSAETGDASGGDDGAAGERIGACAVGIVAGKALRARRVRTSSTGVVGFFQAFGTGGNRISTAAIAKVGIPTDAVRSRTNCGGMGWLKL